jgi:hypothetical protein
MNYIVYGDFYLGTEMKLLYVAKQLSLRLSDAHQRIIRRILVSTLRQVIVVAVVGLLSSKLGILGTVGNILHIARRRGNTGRICVCPHTSNKTPVSRSRCVGRGWTTRRIVLSTQEIAGVVHCSKRCYYSVVSIVCAGGIRCVPRVSQNTSRIHEFCCFIICNGLFGREPTKRAS